MTYSMGLFLCRYKVRYYVLKNPCPLHPFDRVYILVIMVRLWVWLLFFELPSDNNLSLECTNLNIVRRMVYFAELFL